MAQPPSAFSYAVVRVVPDIGREEFLNAGLILFCRPLRFLAARTKLDETALAGTRYYYAVTAVDAAGNESGFSSRVQSALSEVRARVPLVAHD